MGKQFHLHQLLDLGDGLAESSDLLSWYRRLLTPIGVWPTDNNNLRFGLIFVYILIHQTTKYADLVYDIRNIEGIMLNLWESTNFTILLVKFALLYKNRIMGQLIDIMDEHCANSKARTSEEQRKYAVYYLMTKTFKNIFVPFFFTSGIVYCLKPMAGYLMFSNSGTTQMTTLVTFIVYKATMLTIPYGHGSVGECLIDEEDKLDEVSDLLTWYRNLLTPIGIWPKDKNNVRFTLSFVYIIIHIGMEYADFIHQIGNFEGIVANLSESTVFTMLLVKLVVFYKNRILRRMIDVVNEDYPKGKLRTFEEKTKYAVYYSMGKTFYKIVVPLVSITAILYYLKPIAGYLFTTSHNGTKSFVLPYRTHIFYEITDAYTYALVYTYQVGALYIVCLGSIGTDGLLIALTMHVCGQLSALAEGIAKLRKDTKKAHYLKIRSIVKQHLRLIWMEKQINRVFSNLYLGQVFGCASLICLNGFNVVVVSTCSSLFENSDITQTTTLLTFVLYEASMLTALYGYCFVGECLIEESQRVHDAFYQCSWYEMPPSHSKDLVIFIARSQKPFHLTAGKFCIFSMELFTQVVRTAVGYISVLKTMM